jgi:uncharacterized protein involved in exopolysaccharide biosynthesis/Mrp family chromosome partitioning ATPase
MTLPPTETLVARRVPRVREPRPELQHSSFSVSDILAALFKHWWKILLCTVIGLAAGAVAYLIYPVVYESQAKLLVRYVVERSGVDPIDSTRSSSGFVQSSENALGSEVEILTSWDLAVQTAEAIGPKRLLPNAPGTPSKEAAAYTITSGLDVTIHKGSNTIFVAYKNAEPELTTLVLNELVNRYFNKHLEVHRSIGAFDFVTQQTDQVRSRLNQTEDSLRSLRGKLGIASPLAESTAALSAEAARTEEQVHTADSELAEQRARVLQLGGVIPESSPTGPAVDTPSDKAALPAPVIIPSPLDASAPKLNKAGSPTVEIPSEVIQQYQVLISRLPQLRQAKLDLLAKYTPQNQLVRANQAEIDDVTKQCRNLEKKFPGLPSKAAPIGPGNGQSDLGSESARLAGIEAKRAALAADLQRIQERMKKLSEIAPQIADLERQKELEETNYKYFEATLEKARIDEALDPSKIPNISAVQRPSPPIKVTTGRRKLALGLAGGGLALGIALSLLNELLLNRTVKRPFELEKVLGVAPLLSIPYSKNGRRGSAVRRDRNGLALVPTGSKSTDIAPWDADHFVRTYCEAIRDRIGLYFELHQLTHKPKLVGVAGLSEASGASTLAAGLAAAMSETGDGKVLLVDVNLGPEHVHPFFRGKPAYSLKAALQPANELASAADNLYLATVAPANAGPAQLGLKKFFDLMPNLKASDFDYIIFDMPPLSETSPTVGIAPFMDKMLLIVEAEKNHRDLVKRGYGALVAGRDNVSVVFNKAHSYIPKWIESKV